MGDPIGRESVHSEISVSHAFHSCYLWLSKSRGDSSLGAWWLYEHALRRTAGPSLVARPCPGAPLLHRPIEFLAARRKLPNLPPIQLNPSAKRNFGASGGAVPPSPRGDRRH